MRARYWQLEDPEWLRTRYHEQHRTLGEIATEIGCSLPAVCQRMKRYGIQRSTPQAKWTERGTKRIRRFPQLGDEVWLRDQYEVQMRSMPEIADLLGCSIVPVQRAIREHGIQARPPGRIRIGKQRPDASIPFSADGRPRKRYHSGYIKIHVPDHPAADSGGYIPEHRWAAEQTLGRLLTPNEVIHHEDGDTGNNDPSNLIVFPSHRAHRLYHAEKNRQ